MKALKAISTLLATSSWTAAGLKKRATPNHFQLYGYNRGFGGLPLFFADGFAYVGNDNTLNATDIMHAEFFPTTNGVWLVQLTSTNGSASTATNVTFSIPMANNSEKRVSFVTGDENSDSSTTTGFRFYGSLAAHVGSDGQLETLFTGLNVSEGVQAVYWNDTSLGQMPIVLRNEAPSNPHNST